MDEIGLHEEDPHIMKQILKYWPLAVMASAGFYVAWSAGMDKWKKRKAVADFTHIHYVDAEGKFLHSDDTTYVKSVNVDVHLNCDGRYIEVICSVPSQDRKMFMAQHTEELPHES